AHCVHEYFTTRRLGLRRNAVDRFAPHIRKGRSRRAHARCLGVLGNHFDVPLYALDSNHLPNSLRQVFPVFSISLSAAVRRSRCSIGMPRLHSCIQSRAKTPFSVSSNILRSSASLMTLGPRVRTANSHVLLHRPVR